MKTVIRLSLIVCLFLVPQVVSIAQPSPRPVEPLWFTVNRHFTTWPADYVSHILLHSGTGNTFFCAGRSEYPGVYDTHGAMVATFDRTGTLIGSTLAFAGEQGEEFTGMVEMADGSISTSGTVYDYDDWEEARVDNFSLDLTHNWSYRRWTTTDYVYRAGSVAIVPDSGPETLFVPIIRQLRGTAFNDIQAHLLDSGGNLQQTIELDFPETDRNKPIPTTSGPPESGSVYVGHKNHVMYVHVDPYILNWTTEVSSNIVSMTSTHDSGIIVAGFHTQIIQSYVTKLSAAGVEEWTLWLDQDIVHDVIEMESGQLIVVAIDNSVGEPDQDQIVLYGISSTGERAWTWRNRYRTNGTCLTVTGDRTFVMGGYYANEETRSLLAEFMLPDETHFTDPGDLRIRPMITLHDAFPNPFNAATTVALTLPETANVTAVVYDLLGRPVRTLAQNQQFSAGEHRFAVDGTGLASGTYILSLDAGAAGVSSRRITLVK